MYGYPVVIEGDEGGYSAYVPNLPGCVAVGATLDEVRRLMREAIDLHLRGMIEDGLPIPEATAVGTYLETAHVSR